MKIVQHIFFYLLMFTLLTACNKKVEEIPYSNSPVFYVEGTIGSDSVSYVAGENTELMAAIEKQNGVNFFNGTMQLDNGELSIGIFDGNVEQGKFDLASFLSNTQLNYSLISTEPLFQISKSSFSSLENLEKIEWYLDDVFYGNDELKIINPGKYMVCGVFIYTDGKEYNVCNEMIIGYEKSTVFNLQYVIEKDQNLTVWMNGGAENTQEVKWYNNGKLISSEQSLSMKPNSGANFVTAEIKFKNGAVRKRTIMVENDYPEHSVLDFGVLENSSNVFQDYKVKLAYKSNNIVFSTDLIESQTNEFIIDKFQYFGKDKNGTPVYSISGTLKAKVKTSLLPQTLDVNLKFNWALPIK